MMLYKFGESYVEEDYIDSTNVKPLHLVESIESTMDKPLYLLEYVVSTAYCGLLPLLSTLPLTILH